MKILNKKAFRKVNKGGVAIFKHFAVHNLEFVFQSEFTKKYKFEIEEELNDYYCYLVFENQEDLDSFNKDLVKANLIETIKMKLRDAPQGVLDELKTWDIINKSPYSNSFYNDNDIDWGYKPEGSLRISDHWNFESCGETHCKLDTTKEYLTGVWILARYENGIYKEIKRF